LFAHTIVLSAPQYITQGGTPLENIKTRGELRYLISLSVGFLNPESFSHFHHAINFIVTITTQNPIQATRQIVKKGGIGALWTGSPSRTVEGALIGAVFLLGSVTTKAQLRRWGVSPTVSSLAGGLVGGVMQAAIMTPGTYVHPIIWLTTK